MKIDGLTAEDLDIKVYFNRLQRFNLADRKSIVVNHDTIPYPRLKKKSGRKSRVIPYKASIMNATQGAVDNLVRLLDKECVWAELENNKRQTFVYKITIASEGRLIKNVYSLDIDFECDPFDYSLNDKYSKQNNNKLVFNNLGSAETYPIFEFTASSDYRMIAFTHANGRAIQIGTNTGEVVIRSGQKVIINTADCSVLVNGVRVYPVPSSQGFSILPGETSVGITVNTGAVIPTVTGKFKEAWL